jgi:hypothetical protein
VIGKSEDKAARCLKAAMQWCLFWCVELLAGNRILVNELEKKKRCIKLTGHKPRLFVGSRGTFLCRSATRRVVCVETGLPIRLLTMRLRWWVVLLLAVRSQDIVSLETKPPSRKPWWLPQRDNQLFLGQWNVTRVDRGPATKRRFPMPRDAKRSDP